jgi:2-methylcitrate dehydratase PrpD
MTMSTASMAGPGDPAARILATHALAQRFEDLSPAAIAAAKTCLIDAVACAVFGARLPWSRIVAEHVGAIAAPGPCHLPGALEQGLALPAAAMALGAFSHAFELDSLRKPGAGVHPGATVALPALLAAQSARATGRDLITAIVAGAEVQFRIGRASLHTSELIGFHAPGITGTFGAATVAGRLLGLTPEQLTNAYGICGSFSSGLLAFAKAGQGGMMKRLHLGRAAEGGVSAALLARRGFEAPHAILEGRFGVLDVFCERADPRLLTEGLGEGAQITTLCIKRYACHVTAQAPVELLRDLMAEVGFAGSDIRRLTLTVSDKVLSHHAEAAPADLMLAQYSVPFCVALAAFRDPADPSSFAEDALADPRITELARRIVLAPGRPKGWGVGLDIELGDGRRVTGERDSFLGCPERPLDEAGIAEKYRRLTAGADTVRMAELLGRLTTLESADDCAAL